MHPVRETLAKRAKLLEKLKKVIPAEARGLVDELEQHVKSEIESVVPKRLSRQDWLKQELPPIDLEFTGMAGPRGGNDKFVPESVMKWDNFESVVEAYAPSSLSDGVLFEDKDFIRVQKCGGDNEQTSQYCYAIVINALVHFHPVQGLNMKLLNYGTSSKRTRSAEPSNSLTPHADCNFVPDILIRLGKDSRCICGTPHRCQSGCKELLVAEMKRPCFFRNSFSDEVPDLVELYGDSSNRCVDAIHQLMKYMANLRIGYGVLSTADVSFFVRRVKSRNGEFHNWLEISQGLSWDSKHPTVLQALFYVLDRAIVELDSVKNFYFKCAEIVQPKSSTSTTEESDGSPISDSSQEPHRMGRYQEDETRRDPYELRSTNKK